MVKLLQKEDKVTRVAILAVLILFIIMLLHSIGQDIDFSIFEKMLQNFSTIFVSIVLEAMPFIMLGSFISALIQVLITQETIVKIMPKNQFLGLISAALMGFVFPVCECAIVPIARRLIKKGVPVSVATTFMLAVPLVNPVVLISTYYAFYNKPEMVLIRGGFGFVAAIVIGFMLGHTVKDNEVLRDTEEEDVNECYCGCGNLSGSHRNKSKIVIILEHASTELYNIGRYLIIGALISATFQTFVPQSFIAFWGQHLVDSILVMLALAFIMSICSAADAFIAKAFLGQFTIGAIAAFLILGPMIDIKNTLMLSSSFKKKYVVTLIIYVFFICFIIGCFVNAIRILGVI